jgi:TolB-like protein/Tfp pilus assembly protein PilF
MPSLIEGYNYDIFISYRQKDNKGDHWVSEFVEALKTELESTFKEEISVYIDINPHDGLLETHDVDASLKEKLKCLIFIPIISRTYCDPKSFAWEHEFKAFVKMASEDQFGLKVKLPNGNVASRVLPIRIHDLDSQDIKECESVLGNFLRGIEFIYREPGVNKPLSETDPKYSILVNKSANSIKEIIRGLRNEPDDKLKEEHHSDIKKTKIKEKSVIVLPFENISSDPEQEYFSDGLTEEIITNLAHIKDLLVISRSSAMTFKGTGKTIPEIASAVNVSYVLEGSVRKAGNKLRITAQLIDAVNDIHIWAERYDGIIDDIFDIQEKVAENISKELKLKISDDERSHLMSRPFGDALAFEYYLRAKREISSFTEQSVNRAIDYLEKALKIEGESSILYAELAHAYYQFWNMGIRIQENDLIKAKDFVRKAFELDSQTPDGDFVSGLLEVTGGDTRKSISHLRKVLQKSPNHANALFWLAQLMAMLGLKRQAFELNYKLIKVDPFSSLAVSQPVIIHLFCGDFKSAVIASEKLGNDDLSLLARGFALAYNQDPAEANAVYGRVSDLFKSTYVFRADIMLLESLSGKFDMISNLLSEKEFLLWAKNDFLYSFQLAEALALKGEKDQALYWLQNSIERGNFNYPFLNEYDPFLKNLREDARFKKLLKRIKTEWENFE